MNKQNIVIVGTGGEGRECLDLILDINLDAHSKGKTTAVEYNILGFLTVNKEEIDKYYNDTPVLGLDTWVEDYIKNHSEELNIVIGLGKPEIKYKAIEYFKTIPNIYFPTLIHPNALVSRYTSNLGCGNLIKAGVIVSCNVLLGNYNMLNRGVQIGHDCQLQDYNVINPGAILSGNIKIGNGNLIGTNSAIIENHIVGNWARIGAGALVNKDVSSNTTVVGVPAKSIKTREEGWYR